MIGNLCAVLYFLAVVLKRSRILSVSLRSWKIPPAYVGQILGIGIPAAIVNIMSSVSTVLINQFLLPYGNDKIAAMGIATKVSMIVLLVLTGLAFGGQPLFGYYFGAGDKERLSQLLKFCLRFISAVALALSALVFAFAPLLMRCFMSDETIVTQGALMLRWQVRVLPVVHRPPGRHLSGSHFDCLLYAGIQGSHRFPGGGRFPHCHWRMPLVLQAALQGFPALDKEGGPHPSRRTTALAGEAVLLPKGKKGIGNTANSLEDVPAHRKQLTGWPRPREIPKGHNAQR